MISKKLFFFLFLLNSFTAFVLPADVARPETPVPTLNIAQFLEGESSPAPSPKTSPKGSAQNSPRSQQSPRNLQPVDLGAILGESHEGKEAPRVPSPVAAVVFAAQAGSVVAPLTPRSQHQKELRAQSRALQGAELAEKAQTKQKKDEAAEKLSQRLAAIAAERAKLKAESTRAQEEHYHNMKALDAASAQNYAQYLEEQGANRIKRHGESKLPTIWTPFVAPASPKSAQ